MRIAVVTPWFGRELIGGAERHAWELAHALAAAGTEVDVLSTCCRSFNDDWATNYHRAGAMHLAPRLRLLRFRVDSRDRVVFNRISAALTALPEVSLRGDATPRADDDDAKRFVSENINSRALADYVVGSVDAYDAFVFLPYLYGTTLSIAPLVAAKAFLLPCLHDEAYAYLDPVRTLFARVRGLLFNSGGEEETAAAIYGPGIYAKSVVIGGAVDPIEPAPPGMQIRGFVPHRSRYVLYLGRQAATKNIEFLLRAYQRFREERVATSLQLVLAGPSSASRGGDGIVDLGAVSEPAKRALLTYARALAQPSLHESFSRSVYESWSVGRPVVVHGRCRATARAIDETGGGWSGTTIDHWVRIFAEIDESADEAVDAVGRRGLAAAREAGAWDGVAQRVLKAIAARQITAPPIDHAVPLGNKDVAAYARALRDALAESGSGGDILVSEACAEQPGRLLLAHLAGASSPVAADAYVVHDGETEGLERCGSLFAASPAVAARLAARGLRAKQLPSPVSPAIWNGVRPPPVQADERPTILSIAPLETRDVTRIIDTFVAYVGRRRSARLLVFAEDCIGGALDALQREVRELELDDEVQLLGGEIEARYAAYRSASVGVALNTPAIERIVTAHWFDLPLVALGAFAEDDPLMDSGLVEPNLDPLRGAMLLDLLTLYDDLRDPLIANGRRIARRHAPATVAGMLLEEIERPGRGKSLRARAWERDAGRA